MDLIKILHVVMPPLSDIEAEIDSLRRSYPSKSNEELTKLYNKRIRNKYTSYGVASALPSSIPSIGTKVQATMNYGVIATDLGLMLRWMGSICYGTALIYDKDTNNQFSQDFIKILGIWCGVIAFAKKGAEKWGTKVAQAQFDKKVTNKDLQKLNSKIGTTLFTKYGTKNGIALGKLIPFGIGALIGGTANFLTMQRFGTVAHKYFKSDEQELILLN